MKIVKGIFVFIALIIFLVGAFFIIVTSTVIDAFDDSVNEDVVQEILYVGNLPIITVPLYYSNGISLEGISLCDDKSQKRYELGNSVSNVSTTCFNNICSVSAVSSLIEGSEIDIKLNIKDKKECSWLSKTMAVKKKDFYITIEITDKMKEILEITDADSYKTDKSSGIFSYQIMGTKKIKFSYKNKVKKDILRIGKEEIAEIVISE